MLLMLTAYDNLQAISYAYAYIIDKGIFIIHVLVHYKPPKHPPPTDLNYYAGELISLV